MDTSPAAAWILNWIWSLPLIVVTVVIHVVGLGLINEKIVQPLSGIVQRLRFTVGYIVIMAVVAWLVTILHAIEGFAWAVAFKHWAPCPT